MSFVVLQKELYPKIDDSEAKNVVVNTTFILKCVVEIEFGVIIAIDWDLSNLTNANDTVIFFRVFPLIFR